MDGCVLCGCVVHIVASVVHRIQARWEIEQAGLSARSGSAAKFGTHKNLSGT